MGKKVSVVIVTKNEESNISECIRSVSWADEIIVVDSSSEDRTCDLCRELGATVINHKKNMGYGSANRSIFLKSKSLNGDI